MSPSTPLSPATSPPLLRCQGIGKRFGGATALADVDFEIRAGEVHGLVGGNGAGKSTLMKILAGALPDHSGQITIEGQPVTLGGPQAAMARGIFMVYQELSGVGQLGVDENLFLGRQPRNRLGLIDWPGMRRKSREYLAELQIEIDTRRRLDTFPLAIRQLVEIARGIHSGARVLILDEPTSALSPPETERLFALIARLKERGVAIVFISHFIEDVLRVCDRVTILRDGRKLETSDTRGLSKLHVIETMLGHRLADEELGAESGVSLPPRGDRTPLLCARNLGLHGAFERVNLQVAAGECLGLYGFVGAGHQEVAYCLTGARKPTTGEVYLGDLRLRPGSSASAIRQGVAFVASDRGQTVFRGAEIYKNVTLAHLRSLLGEWLTPSREVHVTEPLARRVGCQPASPRLAAGALSGGNQQKVVFARWLAGEIRALVLDEPTRGMDVGAKEDVMRLVGEARRNGAAVLLASSEPELLLAHAQRILVMSRGRVTREFVGERVDKRALLNHA